MFGFLPQRKKEGKAERERGKEIERESEQDKNQGTTQRHFWILCHK